MKKMFFELKSSNKKKQKIKKTKKGSEEEFKEDLKPEPEISIADTTTTKNFQVKELLKNSELRFIEPQQEYKQQNQANFNGPGSERKERHGFDGRDETKGKKEGSYFVCTFLDTVIGKDNDVDMSWLELNSVSSDGRSQNTDLPSSGSKSNPAILLMSKTPDMREYFEKRTITANVQGGDTKILRKLFWFREKECHSVKTRFLSKSLLQFRRSLHYSQIFAYLSKKLDMPSGSNVRSIAWSNSGGFLACGCDTGLVKVLKIEVMNQSHRKKVDNNYEIGKDSNGARDQIEIPKPRGYLAAPTNLAKNQTLNGHTGSVSAMAWNHQHNRLTTTDKNGLTIVWKLCRGCWCEEMVHNKEGVAVQDLSWSHCGSKICIIYADGSVMVGSSEGNRLWGHSSLVDDEHLTSVTWSPDGSHVLFAVSNGDILIYKHDGMLETKLMLKTSSKDGDGECSGSGDDQNSNFNATTEFNFNTSVDVDGDSVPMMSESKADDDKDGLIVSIRWRNNKANPDVDSGTGTGTVPSLAVIWKQNYLHILRNFTDTEPIQLETQIIARCGAWSPNGEYLAIGGSQVTTGCSVYVRNNFGQQQQSFLFDQINLFNAYGSFLQTIKIPGSPCVSLSWDTLSLRLAVGVGQNVYFANIRPCYKFSLLGSNTLVYAFSRIADGTGHVGFWNGKKLSVQEIPGKVVDIKGNEQHCAILSLTSTGCYNAMILNTRGYPVDSMTIVTIDPFMINLAGSVLICVAANAIAIWRFDDTSNHDMIGRGTDIVARRRLRTFHVDESPSIIGDSSDEIKLKEPTKDPASCSDARGQMLIVCRESGKLQVYSLPHGALMNTIDTAYEMNFRPSRIWLNMDGSQVAMIDKQGHLSVCSLGSSSIKTALGRRLDRKDVWSLIWAADHPNLICVMEKTKMYVIRNGETEEPVLTSAYLASFKNLKVTSVLMDELMFNPEEPGGDLIVTLETRALRETRRLLDSKTPLDEITAYIQKNPHCNLWKLLAREALKQLHFELAELAFVKAQDFSGIKLVKKISYITSPSLRNAEISCYFSNFDSAYNFYAQGDRKDLGAEMWKHLEDWKRFDSSISSKRQKPRETDIRRITKAKGDIKFSNQEWGKALSYYETAGDISRMLECYLYLEDYGKVEKLADGMHAGDELLLKIADIFKSRGLCKQAVNAYLKYDYDKPEKAIEAAISLSQWNLALHVSRNYSLDVVEQLLQRYVVHLLQSGRIMAAVQLMIKSNKPYGAGKLLILTALRELQEKELNPLQIKKLFVFAAMLFIYKGIKFVKIRSDLGVGIGGLGGLDVRTNYNFDLYSNSNTNLAFLRSNKSDTSIRCNSIASSGSNTSALTVSSSGPGSCFYGGISESCQSQGQENLLDLDLFFENYLPEKHRPTAQMYKWMRETPWRGAEAIHYFILTQSLLYKGNYEGATRTALYLRNYWDILGKEVVNSMIALTSANARNFSVCSKALMMLETVDEEYEDLVTQLFSEHVPVDSQVIAVTCYRCKAKIPDYSTCCPECNATFEICSVTGSPLSDDPSNVWTCQVCQHSSHLNQVKSRHSCPFCHAERLYSLENLN